MKRFFIVSMIILIFFFLWGQRALYGEPTRENGIEISVDSVDIDVVTEGDTFWISVSTSYLESSWDLGSYDFYLLYDPEIISYQDVSTAGTIAGHASAGVNFLNPGVLNVMWYSLTPLSGEGSIVNLEFQAFSNGSTDLEIVNFLFSDGANNTIPSSLIPGQVVITGITEPQVTIPLLQPTPGYYSEPQQIAITTTTEDAEIYYTLDGTEPEYEGMTSSLYDELITLEENTIVKARVFKQGWIPSEIISGNYYIGGDPPIATLSVESAEVGVGQTFEVAISTTELSPDYNISAVNITINFDPQLLEYETIISEGTLSETAYNGVMGYLEEDGKLNIGWFDTEIISGSGDLLKIQFNAIDTGTSDLILSNIYFNAIEMVDLNHGEVTIHPPIGATISASEITIIHDDIVELSISTSEILEFWNISAFNLTITFDPEILSYEGLVAEETILPSDSHQYLYGYVNPDNPGTLSMGWFYNEPIVGEGDLVKIRFKGINPGFSLLELSGAYLNQTVITDLIDGSIDVVSKLETVEISASDALVSIDDYFNISIFTTELFPIWDVTALNFSIHYEGDLLSYVGYNLENSLIEAGFSQVYHVTEENKINVGWFGNQSLIGDGLLIELEFQSIAVGGSQIEISDFYYNDQMISDVNLHPGQIDMYSTYAFSYEVPDIIWAEEDTEIEVTFETDFTGSLGYDAVRFSFEADGPGNVTFTATESGGQVYETVNSGYWGPDSGFPLDADYSAITDWILNFDEVGEYTITFRAYDIDDEANPFAQDEVTLTVDVRSTYAFDYSVESPILVGEDTEADVTFATDVLGTIGYDAVRFSFEATGPGNVIFTATDSNMDEFTFINSGYWGPDSGFPLDADYTATTNWTLNFSRVGEYTISFNCFEIDDEGNPFVTGELVIIIVSLKPTNVQIHLTEETVTLTWDEVMDATSYRVYSSTDPYGEYELDENGTFSGTSWTILFDANEPMKFFKVRAVFN